MGKSELSDADVPSVIGAFFGIRCRQLSDKKCKQSTLQGLLAVKYRDMCTFRVMDSLPTDFRSSKIPKAFPLFLENATKIFNFEIPLTAY